MKATVGGEGYPFCTAFLKFIIYSTEGLIIRGHALSTRLSLHYWALKLFFLHLTELCQLLSFQVIQLSIYQCFATHRKMTIIIKLKYVELFLCCPLNTIEVLESGTFLL